jgi:murein DD-endopeptidase MepM/ murein hydrolase activator NlpD
MWFGAIRAGRAANVKKIYVTRIFFTLFAAAMLSGAPAKAQDRGDGLNLALPTDNDALFRGGGAEFYQHILREFKGVSSTPWQGGQYGFVRNPQETPAGLLYTRFHEGVDIRPVRRDARGEPLDEVRAIADGTVVHVNLVPGHSNYGKYVVIEHRWDGSSYYSLYGHLASVATKVALRWSAARRSVSLVTPATASINHARTSTSS